MDEHYRVWRRLAPTGLLLVGAGVSVAIHAGARMQRDEPDWVVEGTLGLILLNAGLSVFGEAVKRRALYEVAEVTGGR